ncbi:MAG: ABC transporter permease [Candidatus Marinimicrobia bacterium]|nr:ABC transporter permease [Candidatus Neomarinimicrobiota bacterium]
MLGISSLIIISCISDGFNDIINNKLSGIDGHIRIHSYLTDEIVEEKYYEIDSIFHVAYPHLKFTTPYIEKHAIIRKGFHSEGIILYGVPEKALNDIFQLNQFTNTQPVFEKNNSIIVGKRLADLMDISEKDSVIILNPEKMLSHQLLEAEKFTVINTFQTDFPEYDRLLAFIPIEKAQSYFELESQMTGLIMNVNNPSDVENADLIISESLGMLPYMTTTWKERHASLLNWLNVYDIPIKLIMFFITAVGVFNIGASLWMIILEKTREFGILQSLGLTKSQMREIIIKEGTIIGLAGSIFGILLSFTVLYLESVYHFIQLPNDIYFMNYLPIKISSTYFFSYPIITFLITVAFSYIPAKNVCKICPSEALRYE